MKKYVVKQVYDSDNYMYYDILKEDIINNYNNDIFIGLNRHYEGLNNEILNTIINDILNYSDYDIEVYYKNNIASYIIDTLKPYKKISLKQALKIAGIIKNHTYNNNYDDIQKILSIIYCKDFEYTCLCGFSQGDYIYCFYSSDISKDFINYIEAVFWNTGAEIYISDSKHEIDNIKDINNFEYEGYFEYIVNHYNINDTLKNISDIIGCNIDEIKLYRIKDVKEIKTIKIFYEEA